MSKQVLKLESVKTELKCESLFNNNNIDSEYIGFDGFTLNIQIKITEESYTLKEALEIAQRISSLKAEITIGDE